MAKKLFSRDIKLGSTGKRVKVLQIIFCALLRGEAIDCDGKCRASTVVAIAKLQSDLGIEATGVSLTPRRARRGRKRE
jgi:hypothetical protein